MFLCFGIPESGIVMNVVILPEPFSDAEVSDKFRNEEVPSNPPPLPGTQFLTGSVIAFPASFYTHARNLHDLYLVT